MHVLDLYCGTGGASYGYILAGFDVTGIDRVKRRNLAPGMNFVKADVRDILQDKEYLESFDLIHASPPCQTFSRTQHLRNAQGGTNRTLDLVEETRDALIGTDYVLENVPGAPLRNDLTLCGSMFGLQIVRHDGKRFLQRHRIFETTFPVHPPRPCAHNGRPLGVYGSKNDNIPHGGQTCSTTVEAQELMQMHWASWAGLVEAIPPAYTEWIGRLYYLQNQLKER